MQCSSLLGPFISYEENEVLWIQSLNHKNFKVVPKSVIKNFKIYQMAKKKTVNDEDKSLLFL